MAFDVVLYRELGKRGEYRLGHRPYIFGYTVGALCVLLGGNGVEYVRLGVHIWVSVLIMGTLWRLLQYHLVASSNSSWQHLGRAMALQY